jgi:hypothetical protein
MSDTKPRRSTFGYIAGLLAFILSLAAAYLLFVNRQYVLDQLSVWQYEPTSEIVAFVERSGMNETGKFYFYASQPSLLEAQAFNKECDRKEEHTAILGCYNGRYIYIYNVANEDIDGIREVTAAHEMLHAAYDRLNTEERQSIDKLVEEEYTKLSGIEEFSERMAFYARTEPGERDNELHSLIGTEVADIAPALERHYARYFSDRSKIVTLHQKYATVFSELKVRADALSAQLTQLGDRIETQSAAYNKAITQFNQDVSAFERKAQNNGFTSQEELDRERNALLARADRLETNRQLINDEVTQYNQLRDELLSISSESEALNRSIDSSLAPAPSL